MIQSLWLKVALPHKMITHDVFMKAHSTARFCAQQSKWNYWLLHSTSSISLKWRHDERNGVSNHQGFDCLLNQSSASLVFVRGNSLVSGEFPAQRASNAEYFHFMLHLITKTNFGSHSYCSQASFLIVDRYQAIQSVSDFKKISTLVPYPLKWGFQSLVSRQSVNIP